MGRVVFFCLHGGGCVARIRQLSKVMKYTVFSWMAAGLALAAPLAAQTASAGGAKTEAAADAAESKTGVRFVICSAAGGKVPSPLFFEAKKGEYRQVRIASRIPSERIRPDSKQQICFYDQDPAAGEEEGAKGASARPKKEEIKPVMVINVPAGTSSKALCILVPNKNKPTEPAAYFVSESNLPSRGMHVINMSPYNVRMSTSASGDFSDSKQGLIRPLAANTRGIAKENMWTYTGGSVDNGVAFMLEYQPNPRAPKSWQRIKSSRFVYSDRQAQVTVLVPDPRGKGVKMLSIQMTD